MKKIIFTSIVLILLSGCISKTVSKVVGINNNEKICIIENANVKQDFLKLYKEAIEKQGYKVFVVKRDQHNCSVTTTYHAIYRTHNFAPYLSIAHFRVFKEEKIIGEAEYRAPQKALDKFGKVSKKLNPLITELFSN